MRCFLLIPVWLLTLAIKPLLPLGHPWKHERLSLQWWVEGATDMSLQFGAVFWVHAMCLAWLYLALRT